jgi:hypothetical protein
MQKALLIIFLALLLFGVALNSPILLADDENETDDAEEEDEEEIEIEIEDEDGKRTIKATSKSMSPEQFRETVRAAVRERNRVRINDSELPGNCVRTGSAIRCDIEGGRAMVVMAGSSGNTIIKVREVNMSTRAELYHHNGKVYGVFSDNDTRLINFFPDQIQEMIRERINATIVGNESIELNDEGEYRVEVRKRARFLGIFKIKEKVRFHIDPETGEILNTRAPWWSFLTTDDQEPEEVEEENETEETEEENETEVEENETEGDVLPTINLTQ